MRVVVVTLALILPAHAMLHVNLCRCPLSLLFIQVSRSFAAVIQQLPKVLTVDIMVFYLVLRGLDTVEDDMTAFDDIQVCNNRPRPRSFPISHSPVLLLLLMLRLLQ